MLTKRLLTHFSAVVFCACLLAGCASQKKLHWQDDTLKQKLAAVLDTAVTQYHLLQAAVPADRFARTFDNGQVQTVKSDGWVSGFYPGTLLFLYRHAKEASLLAEAKRKLQVLEKEQYNTHTHDLGFMMYCSFGNALQVEPDPAYKEVLLNSARSLRSRFNPAVGCIRSWDSDSSHFLVIIDNMMNLELLMYAFRQTGDSSFYNVAVTHANTTLKNHFRPDYSSYHVVDYNAKTGAIQRRHTHQGAADESAWARGQAWGLYGFTVMYRETGDENYLNQARHIAQFLLSHPNLPADKIPYWDFNAPGIPNALRDASAGAIMSSALQELALYVPAGEAKTFRTAAETMLKSLAGAPYKTVGAEAGGFLLKHSVGHLPGKSEIDVPLSYADYYFVESVLRYRGEIGIPQRTPAGK